jgi:hypothetical protein
VPEGVDPAFSQAVSEQFHALGIPKEAGQKLAAWWNEVSTKGQADLQAAENAKATAEAAQLERDWGAESPMRKELARRAAVQLGLDEGAIDAMQKVSGFTKTVKALAKMGDLMREQGLVQTTDMGSFGQTPEGAKAKRSQLMADADWRAKAMVPNSAQWAELTPATRPPHQAERSHPP